MTDTNTEAGPSRPGHQAGPTTTNPSRTTSAPNVQKAAQHQKRRQERHKLKPPLPPKTPSSHPGAIPPAKSNAKGARGPDLHVKTIQGARTRRTDGTRDGYGREVVFVTRGMSLGGLMGRCRSLVMDEGYTCLTLHALAAAIPHALLLLHALMDVLPYPVGPRGMWYEIKTGTVDCVDEVKGSGEGLSQKAQRKGGKNGAPGPTSELGEASEGVEGMDVDAPAGNEAGGGEDFGDIGGMEEDEPQREIRLKSSLQIQLHIGPKRASIPANEAQTGREKGTKLPPILHKRNRPSKRQRTVNREAKTKAKGANAAEEGALNEMGIGEEEDMLNFV